MRRLTLTLAAAGAAIAFAAPASAQYYPAPPPPGYGYNQGYNPGYNQGYNNTRALQHRVDGIQRQIEYLHARRMISRDERNGLRSDARQIEYRLRNSARYGLNPNEGYDIERRIQRLERKVSHEVRDGRNRYDNRYRYDRDRDGRDDRYENDRGRDRD